MRINIDTAGPKRPLFLTAANLPTQLAYRLSFPELVDAFVVSVVASDRVLFAASYYFESEATRRLVSQYPNLFSSAHAIFFINSAYHTFTDHGLGKVSKSPITFSPYADHKLVREHGRSLDDFQIIGVRQDRDISSALRAAWTRSCISSEDGSIGSILRAHLEPEVASAEAVRCIDAANGPLDFIWATIHPQVVASSRLAPLAGHLQRKLADLYGEIMALTLGANETSPSSTAEGGRLSRHTIGHLGVLQHIFMHLGIDVRKLQSEEKLLWLLRMPELEIVRQVHEHLISTAVSAQREVFDYWKGLELAEEMKYNRLTHNQISIVITNSFKALGLADASPQIMRRLSQVEKLYGNRFVTHFRSEVERLLMRTRTAQLQRQHPSLQLVDQRDKLLFLSADPDRAPGLQLDRELKTIKRALEDVGEKCSLEIVHEPAVEAKEFQHLITKHRPKYFHFSGHGYAGEILVENGQDGEYVGIGPITRILELVSNTECVVFNACYSEAAIEQMGSRIRYAVVMSGEINDEAAVCFASSFYGAPCLRPTRKSFTRSGTPR